VLAAAPDESLHVFPTRGGSFAVAAAPVSSGRIASTRKPMRMIRALASVFPRARARNQAEQIRARDSAAEYFVAANFLRHSSGGERSKGSARANTTVRHLWIPSSYLLLEFFNTESIIRVSRSLLGLFTRASPDSRG